MSTSRLQTAQQYASAANLQQEDVPASPFILRVYGRFTRADAATVHVYIEGDGLAWLDRVTPSPDPTPRHPLGLALAAVDPGSNVLYLARPCQYIGTLADGTACPMRYWTTAIFAPEVIDAYEHALDSLKIKYSFRQIELIGYSGGGGLAALIAADRHDVINLRTVAGNLDTGRFSQLHNVSPLSQSRNPAEIASRLSGLPQLHFIGAADHIVPPEIFKSYKAASGITTCVKASFIPDMAHDGDWSRLWPQLLAMQPACATSAMVIIH